VAVANEILQAARAGDAEALITSLATQEDVDEAELARPLFVAAQSGHTEVVEILLKHGADPNATFMAQLRQRIKPDIFEST